MIDLMAGDAELRKRLMAFADARLTPELGATTRMRSKVLAVAHRQADLARADAALAVLLPVGGVLAEEDGVTPARLREARRARRRRVAAVLLAATLALGVGTGSAFAARPGGPLYSARVWIETLTLPSSGRARAVAEIERLEARLAEAMTASAAGDDTATNAALDAYAAILDEVSTNGAILADDVASAALQVGVAHNLAVLQALSLRLPDAASGGIQRAIDNAIAHSSQALDTIDDEGTGGGSGGDPNAGERRQRRRSVRWERGRRPGRAEPQPEARAHVEADQGAEADTRRRPDAGRPPDTQGNASAHGPPDPYPATGSHTTGRRQEDARPGSDPRPHPARQRLAASPGPNAARLAGVRLGGSSGLPGRLG